VPVIYECDVAGCDNREDAQCAVTDQGKRVLLPPFRWRLLDTPSRSMPAIVCPSCGEKVDANMGAANDPAPRRPRLGVMDGGKDDDEP
jgi:hypothetical protein